MSHPITALLLPPPCTPPDDLAPVALHGLTLVHIDHYFTAYQQAVTGSQGFLPVPPDYGIDEFDTVGLSAHRHQPDHLDRYESLCDSLGV